MNVIHLSITPLAGAPFRLVKALDKYTDIKCRLVVFKPDVYGKRVFPNDLIWGKDRDACLNLIKKADILHCHHSVQEIPKLIPELDLEKECKAKIIRQRHSTPSDLCVKRYKTGAEIVILTALRYFPNARIVPNIIDESMLKELIDDHADAECHVVFAPSVSWIAAFDHRWDTKATPDVIKILNKFPHVDNVVHDTPFKKAVNMKFKSRIVIDDTATGSLHQGSLGAAALGKPVLCYLDARMRYVLKKMTGAKTLPFILCRIESLEKIIRHYSNASKEDIDRLGLESQNGCRNIILERKSERIRKMLP